MNTNNLTPKLRFPEFKDCGEWKLANGNMLFKPISNKNHDSSLPILAITQDYGAVPREMIEYNIIVSDKSIENYKVVEVGDFIISLRSFQGGIEYSNYKGLCSPAYIILRRKNDKIANEFYKYYFKSNQYIQDLNRNIEGIRDGKMVSYQQFSEILLPFPTLPEQQKIASCLTSIDEVIAAHTRKLELLKAQKKGLMQNLFPQDGEKMPRFRFKEFEKDGEWKEMRLGDIFREGKLGGNYEANETSEGIPLIKMGNIDRGEINIDKIQYLQKNISYNNEDILKEGDLLFNTRNTSDLVGKVAIWRSELPFALYNSNIMRMEFDKKYIATNYYMNYFFNSVSGLKKLKSIATGTTSVAAIYTKDLLNIYILFPSKDEQQKIASCLSSLDAVITAQSEKIEQLKLHKKGLMQQLFPKI